MTRPQAAGRGRPPAPLERRLEAAVLDRVLAWGPVAVVALGCRALGAPAPSGLPEALGAVLLLTAVAEVAVALPLGLWGVSPGTAARGLRLVHHATGRPIGPGRALARAGIAFLALLPTAGLGAATLGWSAATDPGHRRRGRHDRWTGAVLLDARAPAAPPPAAGDDRPAGLVNLTALRLAPAPEAPAWRVQFDAGEELRVAGPGLVGREPEARPGEAVRHLVALADPAVSKTHLAFRPAPGGALVLLDRGSTNGSALIRAGVSRDVEPGRPTPLAAGDVVALGAQRMAVHRDG